MTRTSNVSHSLSTSSTQSSEGRGLQSPHREHFICGNHCKILISKNMLLVCAWFATQNIDSTWLARKIFKKKQLRPLIDPTMPLGLSPGWDFRPVERKGTCHIGENNSVDFITQTRSFNKGFSCVFCRPFGARVVSGEKSHGLAPWAVFFRRFKAFASVAARYYPSMACESS